MTPPPIDVRRATGDDRAAIVALAGEALGWDPAAPNAELFAWKHDRSPFGPSPMWVATVDGELAGFRTFLRWRWRLPSGEVLGAVRAVDTATHPDHRGRGIFRTLTMGAVDEMFDEGVDLVFNTPNDQSRPGYLTMGWQVVGTVPVAVAVRSPLAAARMLRARVPAEKWSLDTTCGDPADQVVNDTEAIATLLTRVPRARGWRTDRTPEFLRWRYADGPLRYRVLLRTGRIEDGLVVFRLRRRGGAVEATICDVIVPAGDRFGTHHLLRRVARATRADYLIRVQHDVLGPGWSVTLPGQGPLLTWRPLRHTAAPTIDTWDLRLGDIELF